MSVEIVKGEDISFDIFLKDSDGKPYDLTGYDLITVDIQGSSSVITKTTPTDVVVLDDPAAGKIRVNLTDANTDDLEAGDVDFEVLIDVGLHDAGIRRIAQFPKGILAKDRLVS